MRGISEVLASWLLILSGSANCWAQSGSQLDGNWSLRQREDQRTAFYAGYYICYIWDVGFRDLPENFQPVKTVTDFYMRTVGGTNLPVTEVFKRVDAMGPRSRRPLGSTKYGESNGDYLRSVTRAERTEYVRGYVACQQAHLNVSPAQPIETYVEELSGWYGTNDLDAGQVNLKTADDKIPVVLTRLLRRK
jgi:hypothetical protein